MTNPNEAIQCMSGKRCSFCNVGGGLGGLTLRFGERVAVRRKGEVFYFTGEYNLWVTTAWRIDRLDRVVVTHNDSQVFACLDQIVLGRMISAIEAVPPAWDLCVEFEGGARLHVFSDRPASWSHSVDNDDTTAWSAYTPDRSLMMVGPRGRWSVDDEGADWP